MYKIFFGFKERPFQLVPNPAYLYLSKSHEEALAHLSYAISQGDGFVEIAGEVGTGKTTLCRFFLESLSANSEAAYIFNPKLDAIQLLKAINDDFNIDSSKDNIKELIDVLNEFLLRKKSENKTVLLLIDEAQNLAPEVLEQLRLLSNLETSTSKLIQIILVGQPELTEKLDSYELRQLGQRITLNCTLLPLDFNETCEYVRHRIYIASNHPGIKFDKAALKAVYVYSRGIPRRINIVCDRALLTAFVMNSIRINRQIVHLAVKELKGDGDARKKSFYIKPVLSAAFLFLMIIVFYIMQKNDFLQNNPNLQNKTIIKVPLISAKENLPINRTDSLLKEKLLPENKQTERFSLIDVLDDEFVEKSRTIALQSILKLWDVKAGVKDEAELIQDDLIFFKLGTRQNGLGLYKTEEDFSFISNLHLPAILEFDIPGFLKSVYLVFNKQEGDDIILIAQEGRKIEMRKDQIDIYWTGISYIPWKNFLGCRGTISQNASAESVISLKMLMRDIGYADIVINSEYDEETEAAVMEIQEKHGIEVDGTVGVLTKMVLYNEAYPEKIPYIVKEKETPPDIQPLESALRVTGIGQKIIGESVDINIFGDGVIEDYIIFTIPANVNKSARIVCDIKCSKGIATRGEHVVPVGANGVDKIRYFTYQGKIRVVVDVDEEKLRMFSHKPVESGLTISISADLFKKEEMQLGEQKKIEFNT